MEQEKEHIKILLVMMQVVAPKVGILFFVRLQIFDLWLYLQQVVFVLKQQVIQQLPMPQVDANKYLFLSSLRRLFIVA